jgi:hypothetical protein
MVICFIKQLLPGLLHFYQLQYPPDHVVRFSLVVLEELFHRQRKLSRKNILNPINELKRGNAQ